MKRIAIERKAGLSAQDFARDHLSGVGRPVIITDATDAWPARTKWTFDHLREQYGADLATAPLGLGGSAALVTSVAAYIDHLHTPGATAPGLWVDPRDGSPLPGPPLEAASPPYLLGWYAFQRHPELYDDILPAPDFIEDWTRALDPLMREVLEATAGVEYWALYLGPAGTLSPLHQDYWQTHSCLAQLQGRKRAILFSPEDSANVYGGAVDAEHPDPATHPRIADATAYEGILEPGDMLFMPAGWWHCVRALEPSMTVSHNFFNAANVNAHLTGIMRRLPRLAAALQGSGEFREKLGITWDAADLTR